jgi:hypothetical protein
VVFIPIRLRNQKWDKYHFSGTQLWQRQRRARTHHAPSSYWLHRIHVPQGQRTLTEVDGAVEIGPDSTLYGRIRPRALGDGRWEGQAPQQRWTTSRQGASSAGWGASSLRAARGREGDGASISCSRSSRRPLRLGGEGECCSVHLPTLATTASIYMRTVMSPCVTE